SGAQGALTPGQYLFGNLKSDPRELIPVASAIAYAHPMEIEQGEQVTTRNANVRSAPAPDAPVLEKLEGGTGVDAIGKVIGQPFVLVAIKGRVRGYVHASLLTPAPGAEVALAGGPTRTPHPCRAFDQTLSLGGQSDRWSGVACNRGQGWRPEPKTAGEPGIL
ncbi:MAG: SH3 domain-containing protein, partial [Parvularculaceae bacterium]|nr:SH3 domain-containing protein [Parvularculaceae bacterium]